MSIQRRASRQILVGSVAVGAGAPVVVQSMNSSPILDVEANLEELERLAQAGCELSRLAVPNSRAVEAFREIAEHSPLPLVADIHFDYRLALGALEAGAAALRLNPGNIHDQEGLKQVARLAKAKGIPIRVGVNSGSLDPKIIAACGGVNCDAMVQSALEAVSLLEQQGFQDICLSLKASNPLLMIESNLKIAALCDYPLHLGLTEAGPPKTGIIRSMAALSPLLYAGVGDTIRISLTADPVEEVKVAWELLKSLELRQRGPKLISCPGCGRTEVDIRPMAERVADYLSGISQNLTVAVMGCAVNGPGEAREADLGLAGGHEEFLVFKKGEIIGKYPENEAFEVLCRLIDQAVGED